jgi:hypothetical protein
MSATITQATGTGGSDAPTYTAGGGSRGKGKVPHLSLAERMARGKAERAGVPRSVHGE